MKKWEYLERKISFAYSTNRIRADFSADLKSLGEQGWELVSTFLTEDNLVIGIFKRELIES